MSTRSTPVVRMNKTATLRAAKRNVDRESTKPKLGGNLRRPAQQKVEPPTYEDQDTQQGEVDEEPEEEQKREEEHDEEHAQAEAPRQKKPAATTQRPEVRSKVSVRAPVKTVPTKKQAATPTPTPHLAFLDLVQDHKGTPLKPQKVSQFVPSFFRLMEINSVVGSLLCPIKRIFEENGGYNTIFTRLAIVYIAAYMILVSRRAASLLTREEEQLLKRLEKMWDFDTQIIPGPYVMALSGFMRHKPADKRYDVVVPSFPTKTDVFCNGSQGTGRSKVDYTRPAHEPKGMSFPFVPALVYLASTVNDGTIAEKGTFKKTSDDSDSPNSFPRFEGRFPVLFNPEIKGNSTLLGAPFDRIDTIGMLPNYSTNAALYYEFYDLKRNLAYAHEYLTATDFPKCDTQLKADASWIDFFMLQSSTRWIATIMEALTFEARFFEGNSTLSNMGFETGQHVMCYTEYTADTSTADDFKQWFARFKFDDDATKIKSHMEGITDADLQFAYVTETIIKINGTVTSGFLNGYDGTKGLGNDALPVFSGQVKRHINEAWSIGHRLRNKIQEDMMYVIDDVL